MISFDLSIYLSIYPSSHLYFKFIFSACGVLVYGRLFCDCVVVNATEMKPLQLGYYNELKSLVDSGKYETKDDFTVVIQPMFVDSDLPVDVSLLS